MIYTNNYNSPIGKILLASNSSELTGLWFYNQKYFANNISQCHEQQDLPIFAQTKNWLDFYFSGENPNFTPPLNFSGVSPFRRRVLEILLTIPYGKTTTYGNIAKKLEKKSGNRVSAQAVGGAVGHNPIAIIIPCHRAIGSKGQLTGYASGIDKKIKLLQLENAKLLS